LLSEIEILKSKVKNQHTQNQELEICLQDVMEKARIQNSMAIELLAIKSYIPDDPFDPMITNIIKKH